jgi:hypothetical protein
MRLPKQRLTINLAEHNLPKPGLDVLANGLASAKLGAFPHRHHWHAVDYVASDVYRNQEFDAEMSTLIITVRGKFWDLTRSHKIYLDVFELSALALAVRLSRAQKLVDGTELVSSEIRLFQAKIEMYRRRAKRAAITTIGMIAYQLAAERWRRFVGWLRYNTLYLRPPNRGEARRATLWREQRLQLTELIKRVLAERFFEALSEVEMIRIVTLAASSLRRSRHSVGLRELLRSPQEHADFLSEFVEKRVELKRLPGAPVPAWQAASDRGDKFREFREKHRGTVLTSLSAGSSRIIITETERHTQVSPKAKTPPPYTHNRRPLTAETLVDAMAKWLYLEVTVKWGLAKEVCELAQFQVKYGHLDQYRIKTAATTFNGVVQELRPSDSFTDIPDIINIYNVYAGWMLGILLALRQQPEWIYQAIGVARGRAKLMEERARYDEWGRQISRQEPA